MAADPHPKFTEAMFGIYRRAKDETGYKASFFYNMINDNYGYQTARTLINADQASDGYTALYELKRLDLTVEALVVENLQWRKLFTDDEIKKAERRLTDYRYNFKRP
jgi:hypothetical protein